jgi:hypothetical protein
VTIPLKNAFLPSANFVSAMVMVVSAGSIFPITSWPQIPGRLFVNWRALVPPHLVIRDDIDPCRDLLFNGSFNGE